MKTFPLVKTLTWAAIVWLPLSAAAAPDDNPLRRPNDDNPLRRPNDDNPLRGPKPLVSDSITLPTLVVWRGATYRVTGLLMATEEEAVFFTDRGQLKIPLGQLPGNLSKVYGDKIKKEQAEVATAARAASGMTTIDGTVLSVSKDGILLAGEDGTVRLLRAYRKEVADGDHVVADAVPDGIFQYPNPLGGNATVHAYKAVDK
jgi:hypothetical protein